MTNPIANVCGHAIGAVADPVVECIDVDGMVRRIDINSALDRVDVNRLMERIDFDKVLSSIDLNKHLERVDVNAIMEQVDINDLVGRSDLGAIIAQSTTGVFSQVLDKLRMQFVAMDLIVLRMKRFQFRQTHGGRLPPKPGRQHEAEDTSVLRCPKARIDQAVAVQGHYCGFLSKAGAIFLDTLFVTLSFASLMIFLQLCRILFVGGSGADARERISSDKHWAVFLYCIYWVLYFFLSVAATGSTIGMSIVGLKVVDANTGDEVSVTKAALRTLLLPLSITVMPLLGVIGFYRKDGRMLHDLVAQTGIVFEWEAQMAKMRSLAKARVKRQAGIRASSRLANSQTSTTSLLDEDGLRESSGGESTASYRTFQ